MPAGARQCWLVATGIMLALCLLAVWQSSLLALSDKLGPGPGFFPFWLSLIGAIRQILGTNRGWPVAMVGTGNLGRALLGYRGFGHQNFKIVAAFDVDPAKIGGQIEGVPIYHLDQLESVVHQHKIKLGMIVVPAPAAQSVADKLIQAGIEGIVNFAPVTLVLPFGLVSGALMGAAYRQFAGLEPLALPEAILATDPASVRDFQAFARQTGNELVEHGERDGAFYFLMKRR